MLGKAGKRLSILSSRKMLEIKNIQIEVLEMTCTQGKCSGRDNQNGEGPQIQINK
jgi:hypothetical protein